LFVCLFVTFSQSASEELKLISSRFVMSVYFSYCLWLSKRNKAYRGTYLWSSGSD